VASGDLPKDAFTVTIALFAATGAADVRGGARMKTALVTLAALTACAFAREDDKTKEDLKALSGTWEYVSQTDDGKETDKETLKGITLTVTAEGKWVLKKDDTVILEGTGKLDPAKKPRAADWTVTTEGGLNGKIALGIYDVDKDAWKHCFSFDKRPEKFASTEGSKVTNAVLKRVKK
jgi:uncharacterized protein (TIGR03067 family)